MKNYRVSSTAILRLLLLLALGFATYACVGAFEPSKRWRPTATTTMVQPNWPVAQKILLVTTENEPYNTFNDELLKRFAMHYEADSIEFVLRSKRDVALTEQSIPATMQLENADLMLMVSFKNTRGMATDPTGLEGGFMAKETVGQKVFFEASLHNQENATIWEGELELHMVPRERQLAYYLMGYLIGLWKETGETFTPERMPEVEQPAVPDEELEGNGASGPDSLKR